MNKLTAHDDQVIHLELKVCLHGTSGPGNTVALEVYVNEDTVLRSIQKNPKGVEGPGD